MKPDSIAEFVQLDQADDAGSSLGVAQLYLRFSCGSHPFYFGSFNSVTSAFRPLLLCAQVRFAPQRLRHLLKHDPYDHRQVR